MIGLYEINGEQTHPAFLSPTNAVKLYRGGVLLASDVQYLSREARIAVRLAIVATVCRRRVKGVRRWR